MEGFEKPRVKSLLDHFSAVEDMRERWRVAHPLAEILLLVVCATMASCDDFDDIAAWGEAAKFMEAIYITSQQSLDNFTNLG